MRQHCYYLTIINPDTFYTNITTCNSYTWPINGSSYTSSGTYIHQNTALYNQTINSVYPGGLSIFYTVTSPDTFSFLSTPTGATSSGGLLIIEAVGDLDDVSERWLIQDESLTSIGGVGGNLPWDQANQCNNTLFDTIVLTQNQINGWASNGSIDFTSIDSTGGINRICSNPTSYLQLTLVYEYNTNSGCDTTEILNYWGKWLYRLYSL